MNQTTETAGAATVNQEPQVSEQTSSVNATAATTPAKRQRKAKVIPASATAEPSVKGESHTDKPLIGSSAAQIPDAMREAAKTVARQNAENARLQGLLRSAQGEVAKLRAVVGNGADGEARFPASDADLRKACDFLIAGTKANPSKPLRSLKTVFVLADGKAVFTEPANQTEAMVNVSPDITADTSKKLWREARKQIDAIHTQWTREEAPKLIGTVKKTLAKAQRNPSLVRASGGYFNRGKGKDAKRVGARISVKELPAKTPGKGPNAAKPTVTP